jgi:phosphoribosylformylglycinamidine cyclo-ligase
VRKIIDNRKIDLKQKLDGKPLADLIMAPTRIYVKPLLALMKSPKMKGMAHITGGGLLENVPRVLPENVVAQMDGKAWYTPALFDWLREMGNISPQEMYRTFNCGIGMILIVASSDVDAALAHLNAAGESATVIGTIRRRQGAEAQTQVT